MKKILVPTDFSKRSQEALDFAIEFNEKYGGKIVLLHVLEIPSYHYSVAGEVNLVPIDKLYEGEFVKGTHRRLEELSKKVTEAGQEVATRLKYGNPYENISGEITEEMADYIIMGSNGASGLREVFFGSNAERIVRHAECPVIVVKGKASLKGMKNMVLASDLDEEQDIIALRAKELQEFLGVNLHLLKVTTPHNFRTKDAVDKELDAFVKRNHFENFTVNSIEADYPDDGIVAFAEKVGAGLIFIGTHGKTGLAHLFGGSRAEDLVNKSKIPVLTMKIPF